jgi:hypothetical protein
MDTTCVPSPVTTNECILRNEWWSYNGRHSGNLWTTLDVTFVCVCVCLCVCVCVCGVYVYVCVCVMMSMSSIVPLMTLPTADQEHDMKRIGLDEVTIYGPSFAVSFFTYVSVLL